MQSSNMDSSKAADLPTLLRFLTQSASIPLADAMRLIPTLQRNKMTSISSIAATPVSEIQASLFPEDEKSAKQLHNAAKRASGTGKRKKGADTQDEGATFTTRKRRRNTPEGEGKDITPAEAEAELVLPSGDGVVETALRSAILFTNRAPLLLAFAVVLLKFTMPEQPLSSRLSLAQAMVSIGARARAITLGIEKNGAEEEGWGRGQPVVRVMGKEVRVLRRWGYAMEDKSTAESNAVPKEDVTNPGGIIGDEGQDKEKDLGRTINTSASADPALWGLDLEALKKSNGPPVISVSSRTSSNGLPIYAPQSARSYLLKSFATANAEATKAGTKKDMLEKVRNLGLLLSALELLYQSWSDTLSKDELDRRAWSWYVAVRPEVEDGVRGWGGKGEVKLQKILDMRRNLDR